MADLTKWDLGGFNGVRQYVWHLLQTELEWSDEPFGGRVPIFTAEQAPEATAVSEPFIVYAYSRNPTSGLYALESEVMSFSIFSDNGTDIDRVVNLLAAKLNKRDESARELNEFISSSSLSAKYKNFDYKSMMMTGAQGPQPVTTEGGRRDGYVNIAYTYTHYGADGLSVRF